MVLPRLLTREARASLILFLSNKAKEDIVTHIGLSNIKAPQGGCSNRSMHMPLFLAATMKRLWRMKRKREKGRERERERDGEVKHLSRLCVAGGLREATTAEEFSDCENTAKEGDGRREM